MNIKYHARIDNQVFPKADIVTQYIFFYYFPLIYFNWLS